MKSIIKSLLISAIAVVFFSASCNKTPYTPNFEHAGGFVIGKETCKTKPDDDYWLVDLSYPLNTVTTYGDTITIGGTFYTNMIKTTQLPATFKIIGKKVSFDFHLSSSKVETTGCTATSPIIYKLKEMQVIASGEIR